jgi:hypothetical protein
VSHPIGFPAGAHFSSLIGGTHDETVHFWRSGEFSSQGIKDMAERGLTSPLDLEVQAAINAGHGGVVIRGGGISPSPGMVSTNFTVSQATPLVTLVSMVAPSPDWFVGVESMSLFQSGEWLDRVVVPLYAWDAGTDCGTTYGAPNCVSTPALPIAPGANPPFTPGVALGLFTFTRTDIQSTTPVPTMSTAALLLSSLAFVAVAFWMLRRRTSRAA